MAKKLTITPKGVLVYPHLTTPDAKFGDPVLKTKIKLQPGADTDALVADLTAQHNASVAEAKKGELAKDKAKRKPVKEANLPFTVDDETGEVTVNAKLYAQGKNAKTGETWENRVMLFGADNKPLQAGTKVTGGSIARIGFEVNAFFKAAVGAGISLRLKSAQIIEARAFESDGSRYGFSVEGSAQQQEESSEDEGGFQDESQASGVAAGSDEEDF